MCRTVVLLRLVSEGELKVYSRAGQSGIESCCGDPGNREFEEEAHPPEPPTPDGSMSEHDDALVHDHAVSFQFAPVLAVDGRVAEESAVPPTATTCGEDAG